jgi:hypothetical protein
MFEPSRKRGKRKRKMMTLRCEECNMERERSRGIRTCPPHQSSAGHGTLARYDPHTLNRTRLKKGRSGGRGETHTTHTRPIVVKEEGTLMSKMLLTIAVRLPRMDDCTWNGLSAGCEHTPLDVHVLALSLRRDRLANRDCRWWTRNDEKWGSRCD